VASLGVEQSPRDNLEILQLAEGTLARSRELARTLVSMRNRANRANDGWPFGNANAIAVQWCVCTTEAFFTSDVKDCAEQRSVALRRGSERVDGTEGEAKEEGTEDEEEGAREEEGPAFSEIIVLAISVSRRQRTRFICRVYCR